MAITKSVASILQGMGSAGARGARTTATPGASMTFTLTNFIGGPINCGTVRVKVAGYTGGGGLTSMAVRGSDGTVTVDLGQIAGSGVAASQVDVMEDFCTDRRYANCRCRGLGRVDVGMVQAFANEASTPHGGWLSFYGDDGWHYGRMSKQSGIITRPSWRCWCISRQKWPAVFPPPWQLWPRKPR